MDHEWLEVHLAALEITWGFWLLLPFDALSRGAAYKSLGDMMPESIWGMIFLTMGTLQMYAIWQENRIRVRSSITLLAIFMWTMVAFMSFYGNPRSTAGVTMTVFTISNTLVYLRLSALQKQSRYVSSPSVKNVV